MLDHPTNERPRRPIVKKGVLDAESSSEPSQVAPAAFWEAGTIEFTAAQSDGNSGAETAIERCRQLLAEDLLPPLAELIDEAARRRSELVSIASTAFTHYLIEWRGQRRYERFLRGCPERAPGCVHTRLSPVAGAGRARLAPETG